MLSDKEKQIVQALAEGKPRKQIMDETSLSYSGVQWKLLDLYRRYEVANDTALTAYCVTKGWVTVQKHSEREAEVVANFALFRNITQMSDKKKPRGKPFEAGNPGKPVGAVAKTPKLVKDWFAETFQHLQVDPEAIEKKADLKNWSINNTTEFYKLSSKLIPIQIAGDPENPLAVNMVEGMTFEQLYQLKYGVKP